MAERLMRAWHDASLAGIFLCGLALGAHAVRRWARRRGWVVDE